MHIFRPTQQVFRNAAGEPAGGGVAPAATPSEPTTTEPAAAPAPATPDPAAVAAPSEPDFSWLPEEYRGENGPDIDAFRTHYEDIKATLGAVMPEDLPDSPDGYDISVPDDIDFGEIQVPEWFKFELDQDNPVLGELRQFMHDTRMPTEAASKLMSMLARYEAGKAAQFHAAAEAEMKALGSGAQDRIGKIQRTLETRVRDPKQRDALLQSITSADAVRGLEALISGSSSVQSPVNAPANATDGLTGYARLTAARNG